MVRSRPLPYALAMSAPLTFHPEIRYECTGCGVCCRSFLLGPLRSADVERIEELSWPEGMRLPVGRQALRYLQDKGDEVPFLRSFRGCCVFQDHDGLCAIQRHHGGSTKPLVCRLFPYVFTRLGSRGSARIAVSLQFESASLWAGHASARPIQEDRAELRKLLAELGSVTELPDPVPLCEGRSVPLRTALRADATALEAIDAARLGLAPSELAARVSAPLLGLLGSSRSRRKKRSAGQGGPLPPVDAWLEAQLAWQQEIHGHAVPLLPETLAAQHDLLEALEARRRGRRPLDLSRPDAAAFCRSWLRSAIFGRDAYRAPDLVSGWLRSMLRLAVLALLAGKGRSPKDRGMDPAAAAVRSSKLFQLGHSPDRPAAWVLRDLGPAGRVRAVLAWLSELERE